MTGERDENYLLMTVYLLSMWGFGTVGSIIGLVVFVFYFWRAQKMEQVFSGAVDESSGLN